MNDKLILFVHGLGGDGKATWQTRTSDGFLELIRKDADLNSQYDVAYYEYPTSLFPWPFGKVPKIQDLAEALKTQIENRYPKYASIVLVCHSLGGLIARQYLINEVRSHHSLRVNKLLLYAAPNKGADLASVAKIIPYRNSQLAQLAKDSDLIYFLERDWLDQKHEFLKRLEVKYVIGLLDQIVDIQSAKHDWDNSNVETIADKGHIDIVKPENAGGDAFIILKKFVDERRTINVMFDMSHGQSNWDHFKNSARNLNIPFIDNSLLGEKHIINRSAALVLALPYRSRAAVPELPEYLRDWVDRGGGLLLLGYYATDCHHGPLPNLNAIARYFGYEFLCDQVLPEKATEQDCREIGSGHDDRLAVQVNLLNEKPHPLAMDVTRVAFRLACSINQTNGPQPEFWLDAPASSTLWVAEGERDADGQLRNIVRWLPNKKETRRSRLLVAFKHGKGRIVLCGTWKISTYIYGDNAKLFENALRWLSSERLGQEAGRKPLP